MPRASARVVRYSTPPGGGDARCLEGTGDDERGEQPARHRGHHEGGEVADPLDPELAVGVEAEQERAGGGREHGGHAEGDGDARVDVVGETDPGDRHRDRDERGDRAPPAEQQRRRERHAGPRGERDRGAGTGVQPGDPLGGGQRGEERDDGGDDRVAGDPAEEGRETVGHGDEAGAGGLGPARHHPMTVPTHGTVAADGAEGTT